MAGQGSCIGGTFQDLRDIIDLIKDRTRIGVCLDTCHLFAAGYDIRTAQAWENVLREVRQHEHSWHWPEGLWRLVFFGGGPLEGGGEVGRATHSCTDVSAIMPDDGRLV